MTNTDGVAVPEPGNDKVWESWVQDLLSKKHGDTAVAYGRSGQKQHGIDFVIGATPGRIGVQCKFVKSGSKLDLKQVKEDYAAALQVSPPLAEFHLYTSAESDTHTIDLLATYAQEVAGTGPTFRYFMRRDFESEVRQYGLLPRLLGLDVSFSVMASETSTNPAADARLVAKSDATVRGPTSMVYGQMLESVRLLVQQGNMAAADGLVKVLLSTRHDLSDSELARVYATQAILASRNGDPAAAARLWRASADIEPQVALQQARRAQAFLCEDRYAEAYAQAVAVMAMPSPPALAAVVLIVSAGQLGKRREAEALLTPRLKQERDIALVRAYDALEDGRFEEADQIRRDLELLHPDECDTRLIHANSLFQRALGGLEKRRPEAIQQRNRGDLIDAKALYQQALQRYDPKWERSVWLPAALNLVSVLKILGQYREAADVASSAVGHYGTDIEDFPSLAIALAEGGRASEALRHIESIASPAPALRIAQASALLHLNQFTKALTVLKACADQLNGLDADNARWMLLYAQWKVQATPDLERLTEDFYDKAEDKLSACQRIVQNASHLGFPALSEQYAKRAIALYEQAPDPDRRLFIANAKLIIDDPEGAVEILSPAIELDRPQGGPLEELYAFCLLRLHRLESLDKLLSGLPADSAESARFDGYRIDAALQRGDRPQALTAVQAALQRNPSEIKLRTLEALLLREAGLVDQAKDRLSTIEYRTQAPLNSIALFAREARLLGACEQADEFVYRWIRENGEDPENVAWFLAQFLMARASSDVDTLDTVTTQCGLSLQATRGEPKERWLVIDSRFPEAAATGWFTPNSHGMQALLGRRCGDVVDLPVFPGGPFLIKNILPIHGGAFKLLMSHYGDSTPMSASLRQMSIQTIDGRPDLTNVFEQLDASRNATQHALAIYAETPISLGHLAGLMRRNPLDIWRGLYGGTEHHVRSESAGNALLAPVVSALGSPAPTIILDPITLVSWTHWGLLPLAKRLFPRISMTASAVDILNQKIAEVASMGDGPQMQLAAGDQPGQYTRIEVTPAMMQAERDWLEKASQFIREAVSVCPTPLTGLPEDVYSTMRYNWPPYLADQMQLAAHQQGILVADDLFIERLCVLLKLTQASTRLLFLGAHRNAHIDVVQYTSILAKLAEANYEFISFSHTDLIGASTLHGVTPTPALVALLRYMSVPSLDLRSALQVLANYWQIATDSQMSTHLVEATVSIALSALTRHATRCSPEIIDALDTFARDIIGGKYGAVIHAALSQWCSAHFLPSPPAYSSSTLGEDGSARRGGQ
ncbi:Flp pilus assembly protein TadD%2C contains TPR repeats [Bordetella ansorpii]|uniref:Flp pilus assembly protein TadD, contains TPR repeats n=1 Tax=Bordetella ansorpii TaxID=288768 RepID=A0A157QLU0_9BORD|nr:hypothetical protein [Bordetella ansorpii]SAI46873.1 Flp pilus assembly protein TadD%2C contains TPR repeats [Bordetella ansorpii]